MGCLPALGGFWGADLDRNCCGRSRFLRSGGVSCGLAWLGPTSNVWFSSACTMMLTRDAELWTVHAMMADFSVHLPVLPALLLWRYVHGALACNGFSPSRIAVDMVCG